MIKYTQEHKVKHKNLYSPLGNQDPLSVLAAMQTSTLLIG